MDTFELRIFDSHTKQQLIVFPISPVHFGLFTVGNYLDLRAQGFGVQRVEQVFHLFFRAGADNVRGTNLMVSRQAKLPDGGDPVIPWPAGTDPVPWP